MRDIKFRAYWKPKEYEWDEERQPKMIYFDTLGYCDEYNHLSFRLAGKSRNDNGGDYSNLGADIDDMTVMQYTGLKDKNGVEIYEGDVVTHYGGTRYRVITYTGVGFGSVRDDLEMDIPKFSQDIEVIGNIYEHPQLTEVK